MNMNIYIYINVCICMILFIEIRTLVIRLYIWIYIIYPDASLCRMFDIMPYLISIYIYIYIYIYIVYWNSYVYQIVYGSCGVSTSYSQRIYVYDRVIFFLFCVCECVCVCCVCACVYVCVCVCVCVCVYVCETCMRWWSSASSSCLHRLLHQETPAHTTKDTNSHIKRAQLIHQKSPATPKEPC